MTRIQPELWVENADEAVTFYTAAFGAEVLHRVGEGDDIVAQLGVGDAAFWVAPSSAEMKRFSPGAIDGATSRILLVVEDPESVVREKPHPVGFDQQVDDERAPGLPLTVQTMTAMDEQRSGHNPVANGAARAAALKWSAHSHLQQGWSPDCTSGPAHESIGVVRWIAGVVGLGGSAT